MLKSLDQLKLLRKALVSAKLLYLRRFWKMDIDPSVQMSLSVRLDKTFPKGIHIGANTYLAFDVSILTHDMTRRLSRDVHIGRNCFIGGRSLILPGVVIGDNCIVGAGSVVTKSVPNNCIVAGNPARVLKQDVEILSYGRIAEDVRARAAEIEAARAATSK